MNVHRKNGRVCHLRLDDVTDRNRLRVPVLREDGQPATIVDITARGHRARQFHDSRRMVLFCAVVMLACVVYAIVAALVE